MPERLLSTSTHIRIARPSRNLQDIERFYVQGLGMSVLYKNHGYDEFAAITIVGLPGAVWHLEFTRAHAHAPIPTPTEEDLLVLYLGTPPSEALLTKLDEHGGTRVQAMNPYWTRWGVTVQDPDGYRLVLSHRRWDA